MPETFTRYDAAALHAPNASYLSQYMATYTFLCRPPRPMPPAAALPRLPEFLHEFRKTIEALGGRVGPC